VTDDPLARDPDAARELRELSERTVDLRAFLTK
jgi:hypothetical protein